MAWFWFARCMWRSERLGKLPLSWTRTDRLVQIRPLLPCYRGSMSLPELYHTLGKTILPLLIRSWIVVLGSNGPYSDSTKSQISLLLFSPNYHGIPQLEGIVLRDRHRFCDIAIPFLHRCKSIILRLQPIGLSVIWCIINNNQGMIVSLDWLDRSWEQIHY